MNAHPMTRDLEHEITHIWRINGGDGMKCGHVYHEIAMVLIMVQGPRDIIDMFKAASEFAHQVARYDAQMAVDEFTQRVAA